jgi:hypothetical protein
MTKVKAHPERSSISIRGSEWTLWIRRVRAKDGEALYAVKILEPHVDAERKTRYTQLKHTIWLNQKQIDQLITSLIQLTEAK